MTEQPSPFTVDDLYQIDWLEDPRWSPDGREVAYVRVSVDRVANRYRRAIWLAGPGSAPRRFSAGTSSDTTPRWSPDGQSLAFVSTRDGDQPQIYTIGRAGGEASRLTSMPNGATAPAWSPDGKRIVFLSPVNAEERDREDRGEHDPEPQDAWEQAQAAARRAHAEAQRVDPRIVQRLPYRSGTTFFDGRRTHIFVIDLPEDDATPPGQPRRLTDGDLTYSAPAWVPDGSAIVSTAQRDPEADAFFAGYDLVRVPVLESGRGALERLTEAGYSYYDPHPSPDGRWIAVRRRSDDRPITATTTVAVLPTSGGPVRDITAATDLNVEQFHWLASSDGVLYSAGWRGEVAVRRAGLAGAADRDTSIVAGAGRYISDFAVAADGSVAYVAGTPADPCQLYLRQAGAEETARTQINIQLLRQRAIAACEEVISSAPDGSEVQGWLLRPHGYDPSQRYPLIVHIHGGPHAMWGPGYRSMWHEWQAAAGRGYNVFFCNPRASDGYGEAWREATSANWGVADAPDIHAGIDSVLARGGVDPDRIAVTGGSYGGYMTVWLIAHSTRFACAVAARGVYNLLTEHSTSDAHELIEHAFGGYPWEIHERLWQHSPLAHAQNITTPLLILHSEHDYRVPISEAEQLFAVLRRRRQAVEFVRYPREGHELTRSGEPRHRVDHMERTLSWCDRYCQ